MLFPSHGSYSIPHPLAQEHSLFPLQPIQDRNLCQIFRYNSEAQTLLKLNNHDTTPA